MTDPLAGIDLVVLDKDGTLISFGSMWHDWAEDLGDALSSVTGRDVRAPLYAMLGFDPISRTVQAGGGLAATPMARLRDATEELLVDGGSTRAAAAGALGDAWHAPDPVRLAQPLTDLTTLLARLRQSGRLVAIATSDDRTPTEQTLVGLGIAGLVEVTVCADDGVPVKPAPDMVLRACAATGVDATRTAVVGDSPSDLLMGRAAGAGRVIGVLTGVGTRADLEPLADMVLGSVGELLSA